MTTSSPNRREMLLATSGIIVAGATNLNRLEATEPADAKDLIFRTTDPRNAEPEVGKLIKSWITPTKHFYVRSHAPNPVIQPTDYRLQIEGLVRKPITLSLAQLARFSRHDVTATLTCAGNRRSEYNAEGKVGGVQWGAGAIGNAKWSGFSLADVLRSAEVLESAGHVWFEGLDEIKKGDAVIPFGGSIPIQKAMTSGSVPGALLVDRMNGLPLSADHGFPLRTVVPGYIGARSVKWLGRIVVSDKPSPNHYLATAYKIVKQTEAIDWAESGPIYRFPVNAAAAPLPTVNLQAGPVQLSGYALPTGRPGSTIRKVFVSSDGGQNWTTAKLNGNSSEFCWQLWSATLPVTRRTKEIIVRASDTSGGFMPVRVPWNAKGYLQNSWYRMPVSVRG